MESCNRQNSRRRPARASAWGLLEYEETIEHAGGSIDGVVQLMSFLADKGSDRPLMEDFNVVVEVQKEFFTTGRPCGTVARVKQLALPDLLVELQAIVAL
jgi:enamine deaminase RidA (YjgF/YER057c/UK114 family)